MLILVEVPYQIKHGRSHFRGMSGGVGTLTVVGPPRNFRTKQTVFVR